MLAFAFLPPGMVYADSLAVFALSEFAAFSVLQSRTHDVWARFFGSSIKDDLRYTPSDCFETFPLPEDWKNNALLEKSGEEYYKFRSALMLQANEGLTETYNRFHNPDERDPEILKLRELHLAMDSVALASYGWSDIKPTCEFILDYEADDGQEGVKRLRKKPWRYRWPDGIRDIVLARLLELNQKRTMTGASVDGANPVSAKGRKQGRRSKRGGISELRLGLGVFDGETE